VLRKKKKNHPEHAFSMFNDHVASPVIPKYFARQSTNLVGQELKKTGDFRPIEVVNFVP
jgi:hypothetical protein